MRWWQPASKSGRTGPARDWAVAAAAFHNQNVFLHTRYICEGSAVLVVLDRPRPGLSQEMRKWN